MKTEIDVFTNRFQGALTAFDNLPVREVKEPEQEPIERQIEAAKRKVENKLNAEQYDRSGIKQEFWDFLIQLAAERIVQAQSKDKAPVGRITAEKVGFILLGRPRAGKTFLMRILYEIGAIPRPVGEAVIKNDFQAGGIERVFSTFRDIRSRDFTLDDLGIIQDTRSYGNAGVIESILFERYENWQGYRSGATFISSNYEGYDSLKDVYGEQFANRIIDMCVKIPVDGAHRGLNAEKRFVLHSNNQQGETR